MWLLYQHWLTSVCQALWLGISNKSFNPHKKTKAGIIITAINPIIKMRKPGLKKESDLLQSVSIQACVCLCARAHTHTHINDGIVQQLQTPKEAPWLQDISLPSVSIQGSNTLPPRAPVSPSSQANKEALPLHTPSLGWSVLLWRELVLGWHAALTESQPLHAPGCGW